MQKYRSASGIPSWAAILFLLVPGCEKPEQSVRPGVNEEYGKTPLETWVERFEGESREVFRERSRIAELAGAREGMAVADIGAGTGAFIAIFSRQVGESGRVYAVDIMPAFVERIRERARDEKLSNVTAVLCGERDTKLPTASVDLAFVCDTYHHFEFPKTTLASIRRALRRGGMLVVVDFDRIPGKSRPWVVDHVRAGKDEVRQEIEAAGFEFVDLPETPFLAENYMMRFRRGM